MQMSNLSGFETLRYGACSQRTIYNFSDNSDRQGLINIIGEGKNQQIVLKLY